MTGKLEPRAWPGENRWGFGSSVTPRYPQVGQASDDFAFEAYMRPPQALPEGKSYGGRTTITKRRTGEASRPEDTRITAQWDVANRGGVTAKASLRLRLGTARILATSLPTDVIAGTQKSLVLWWNIPSDMGIGGHNLTLDIMQTWQDGANHRKVVAVHEITLTVVGERRGRIVEDLDLGI